MPLNNPPAVTDFETFHPDETIASATSALWDGVNVATATATITGTTNVTTAAGFNLFTINIPTLSWATAHTVTNAASLTILGAPVGGGAGPATITNAYALWVQAGTSYFGSAIIMNTTTQSTFLAAESAVLGVTSTLTNPGNAQGIGSTITLNLTASQSQDYASIYGDLHSGSSAQAITGQLIGGEFIVFGESTAATVAGTMNGILTGPKTATTSTANYTTMQGIAATTYHYGTGTVATAIAGYFNLSIRPSGGAVDGNITTGDCIRVTVSQESTAGTLGTIATARGIHVTAPSIVGTAPITNCYGIHINNQSFNGATNSWGLYIDAQTAATNNNPFALFINGGRTVLIGDYTVASGLNATWKPFEFRASTATITGSTNITTVTGFNFIEIAQPVLSNASVTVSNSATLTILNAPTASGGMTINNPRALWVQAGATLLNGQFSVTGTGAPFTGTQTAASSGTPLGYTFNGGAHTSIAIAEVNCANWNIAQTVNFTSGGGTIATQRSFLIQAPTFTATTNAVILTSCATLEVTAAPTGSTNITNTSLFALNVASSGPTVGNAAATIYGAINVAAHTITLAATTGVTSANGVASMHLNPVTINQSGGAVTVTNAATLDIAGPPVAGASVTLTNLYALRVQSGTAFMGGTLAVNAGLTLNYRTASTTDAIATTDTLLVYTGGPFTATLPTAVGVTGKVYMVKAPTGGTNNITIATTSSQTIDGASTLVLNANNEAALLVSDGANWKVMSDAATTIL